MKRGALVVAAVLAASGSWGEAQARPGEGEAAAVESGTWAAVVPDSCLELRFAPPLLDRVVLEARVSR